MRILLFLIFVMLARPLVAMTWQPAYPYKQHIEGQNITIEAIPYYAYAGSPLPGITNVYFGNKLLYTINKYYREKIFTSKDGQYLAVLHTTNATGVSSIMIMGHEKIDYSQAAIDVFKNGDLFKTFSIQAVIDTSRLWHNGYLYDWGYHVNVDAFLNAQFGCEACVEVYGKKVLKNCDTAEISYGDCEECKRQCDSIKLRDAEVVLMNNSSYVDGNYLYVLSNQGPVIRLDFESLLIEKLSFNEVIPNRATFHPPRLIRKYNKVHLPNQFDLPDLKNGKKIENASEELFATSKNGYHSIEIFISSLTIDRNGLCINADVTVSVENPNAPRDLIEDTVLTKTFIEWIKKERFKTNLIPRRFDRYSFYSFITLK